MTIGQLLEIEVIEDLMEIKNFGVTCLNEVKELINNMEGLDANKHLGVKYKIEIPNDLAGVKK